MQQRKQVIIKERELSAWVNHFALYGTKSELELHQNISRGTLSRILKKGRGDVNLVKKIRAFIINVNA